MSEKEFSQIMTLSYQAVNSVNQPTDLFLLRISTTWVITNFVTTVSMPMTYVIIVKLMLTNWNLQTTIK